MLRSSVVIITLLMLGNTRGEVYIYDSKRDRILCAGVKEWHPQNNGSVMFNNMI